ISTKIRLLSNCKKYDECPNHTYKLLSNVRFFRSDLITGSATEGVFLTFLLKKKPRSISEYEVPSANAGVNSRLSKAPSLYFGAFCIRAKRSPSAFTPNRSDRIYRNPPTTVI